MSWARQVSGRRLAAGSAVRPTQTWHGHGPGPWRAEFESGYKGGGCKAWTYGFGCKAGAGAVTHKLDELTDSTTTLCALVLFCLLCVAPQTGLLHLWSRQLSNPACAEGASARGTAAWLCGDAGGSHLSAPIRGEVASKSKPSPSPKMSSRTLTAPGAMGTSKSSCKGGARGGHSHSWRLRRTEPATFDIFPRRLVAFHPAAQRTSGRRSTWLSLALVGSLGS